MSPRLLSGTPALLWCDFCDVATAQEVIRYRLHPDSLIYDLLVCPGCCQPEIARLRAAGYLVVGVTDCA